MYRPLVSKHSPDKCVDSEGDFIFKLLLVVSQEESLPRIDPEIVDVDVGEGRTIVDAPLPLLDPEIEIDSEPESFQVIGEEKAAAETAGKPDGYGRECTNLLACLFLA